MKIGAITSYLESLAHPSLQESYDNAGLITGDHSWECTGIVCSLDATEDVIKEAIKKKCNLVIAHHPIIFSGLKKINGKNYVEKTIIQAIKNDIAVYAIHTNLDNVIKGVSGRMAEILDLVNVRILSGKEQTLKKLYTFIPNVHAEKLRAALFSVGAGVIGEYEECSFNAEGYGTFKGSENSNPFVGKPGRQHREAETRIELVFPSWLEKDILSALRNTHPYEEPAFDIINLANSHPWTGSGIIGELKSPMEERDFLNFLKDRFSLKLIRHTPLLNKTVKKVALCGGAGSFLISKALSAGADFYITGDIKYHEFFDANNRMVVADIGHYESEQYTIDLLFDLLRQKFPTFALLKTEVETNPVQYFI